MLSTSHLIVILLIVIILFGSGKISKIMQDIAKGIKIFKKEMNEDNDAKDKE